ncbi:MAG: hypothetical protein ACRD8U_13020 [Pyrinomonadaceae bacterium]
MKRCSVCEFIYEDDQRFCEMDGIVLPSDSSFQFSQKASGLAAASRLARFLRSPFSLAALSLLGVILSALVIGYYDSISQTESNAATRQSVGSLVPSAHAESTDALNNQEGTTSGDDSATDTLPTDSTGDLGRSSRSNAEINPPRSTRAGRGLPAGAPKRDSKVTKMFKKTGRFLTRPFKKS